jgi:tetratricopeptide (TPR) repeat protein
MNKRTRIFFIIVGIAVLAVCANYFRLWVIGRSVAYVEHGRSANDREDYDQAIADYTQAIKLNHGNSDAYLWRGRAYYYGKEDYDQAIADFTKAIKLKPDDYPYYTWRGRAYNKKEDYDQAIADFTESIKLAPDSGHYKERGDAYGKKGDYDLAIADYDFAVADIDQSIAYRDQSFTEHPEWYDFTAPTHEDYYSERDSVSAAKKAVEQIVADNEAMKKYTEAIHLHPNDASAYIGRGDMYQVKEEYDLAIADYTVAIKLQSNNTEVYRGRGDAYSRKEEYDLAIADYTKVIKLQPRNAEAYRWRGDAYSQKSEYDMAIADYTASIELQPSTEAYMGRSEAYSHKGGSLAQSIKDALHAAKQFFSE